MEEQAERSGRGITRVMRGKIIEESKPYLLCVFANICFGGFNIVSKVSLDQGMSCYVLVFYGNAFGTLASAPLALILERKIKRKITLLVLRDIFLFGLLGAVLGRTLYYVGLEKTSPTFASAMANLMPSITFVLAVVCRMEKLDMSKHDSIAKVVGTAVAFGGAALMTLYKGIKLISIGALVHIKHSHQINTTTTSKLSLVDKDWIKGSFLLFLSYFSLSAYYILQAKTIKMYPAPITLTSLTCLSGTLLSAIMAAIFDHKASSWKLSWDITLLAPLYSGIVIFAITVYVQTLVTRIRGPVFMTAFRPFATLIVALMGFILGEDLHLGSIVGALLIIVGLYTMLWGKEKEMAKNVMERSDSIPIAHHQEDIEIVKQEK